MYLNLCISMFFILGGLSMVFIYLGVYFFLFGLVYLIEWNLVSLNSSMIVYIFLFDWMSLLFMGVVLLISSMVILYSNSYMMGDLNIDRFIYLVLMFILSMMLMVISPNLISILLGWDGLGLVSYCLVIYYQNYKSFNAGMLTVLSNRIGDVFFLISISWMLNYGSWNFMFYLDFMSCSIEMNLITILIFIASITKSAQIPFSSWLPAAMAAPTPVSALVHSSTLVTAGVYLMIRFSNLFSSNELYELMLFLSGLTMFMSGMVANFEYDLKKIIALSTLSQLGLMFMILSRGMVDLTFFHLLVHAGFKALLFMCSGMMIHSMNNIQDIRFMGSFSYQMPMTSICFNISNMSLCGVPFLAGFYSKDLILESLMMMNMNFLMMMILIISTLMTVSYTFRLIYFTMQSHLNSLSLNFLGKEDFSMLFGMYLLMFFSVTGGSILSWIMLPFSFMICLPLFVKLIPLGLIIFGAMLGKYFFFINLKEFNLKTYFLKSYLMFMWFLPILTSYGISKYPLKFSFNLMKTLDGGWEEYLGGQGVFMDLKMVSQSMEWLSYNKISNILIMFFIFYIFMFFILMFL